MKVVGVVILLFTAGFLENFINGWHTRAVSHGRTLQSMLSGCVYVMTWYTALRVIIEYLSTPWVALAYALGSGCGSMCIVLLEKHLGKRYA